MSKIYTKQSFFSEERLLEDSELAYLINLLNVSLAQIIKSKDAHIMEQEYQFVFSNLKYNLIPVEADLFGIIDQICVITARNSISDATKDKIRNKYKDYMAKTTMYYVEAFRNSSGYNLKFHKTKMEYFFYRHWGFSKNASNSQLPDSECPARLSKNVLDELDVLRAQLYRKSMTFAESRGFSNKLLSQQQICGYIEALDEEDVFHRYALLKQFEKDLDIYVPLCYYLAEAEYNLASQLDENERRNLISDAIRHTSQYHFEGSESWYSKRAIRFDYFSLAVSMLKIDILFYDKSSFEAVPEISALKRPQKTPDDIDMIAYYAITCLKIGDLKKSAEYIKNLIIHGYNADENKMLLEELCKLPIPVLQAGSLEAAIFDHCIETSSSETKTKADVTMCGDSKKESVGSLQAAQKACLAGERCTFFTPQEILQAVCSQYGVTVQDLNSKKMTSEIILARQVFLYLCNELTSLSEYAIGSFVGVFDHKTMKSGIDRIRMMLNQDKALSIQVSEIKVTLYDQYFGKIHNGRFSKA